MARFRAVGEGPSRRAAFAPGRVNLMGDHTDYTGGWALPMAIQLGTTVEIVFDAGHQLRLHSDAERDPVTVAHPPESTHPAGQLPRWGRYVAGVVAQLRSTQGGTGRVSTTLPIGAGLASSAALEVALALALGFEGNALDLARLCQRAEAVAAGVPCGIMDQLAAVAGVAGHALLLDCGANSVSPVPLPQGVEVVAVHCGEPRALATSAYAQRRASCANAARSIGPLRNAGLEDLGRIPDPEVRRRARHVITENTRTTAMADALRSGRLQEAGALMGESHRSLRDDFEVVTPALDGLVTRLARTPGVLGARMTGAGFGGCAVALCQPGALGEGWRLDAVGPAHVLD